MTTSKKYSISVEKKDAQWVAKITRKITSKKSITTKQKDSFSTAEQAQKWAEASLAELTETLKKSNQRHGAQRKQSEEVRRLRSARRAEKTELAKRAKEKAETENGDAN